ncbi:hypothetical protein LTR55_011831, partial [Exophiala xenobiotica]
IIVASDRPNSWSRVDWRSCLAEQFRWGWEHTWPRSRICSIMAPSGCVRRRSCRSVRTSSCGYRAPC